jgi:hypothetical protein
MTRCIGEQEQMAYIEGGPGAEERSRIEDHLRECAQCRSAVDEVRVWRNALLQEGSMLRGSLHLPQAELDRMLRESLHRIQVTQPSRRITAREALMALRALTEPILGRGMVEASVAVALRHLGANSDVVPPTRWREFVGALSDSVSAISGVTVASLVNVAGRALGDGLLSKGGQA